MWLWEIFATNYVFSSDKFVGAAESSTEESGVIRFVDSENIRHEKESTIHGQEHTYDDFVAEGEGNARFLHNYNGL